MKRLQKILLFALLFVPFTLIFTRLFVDIGNDRHEIYQSLCKGLEKDYPGGRGVLVKKTFKDASSARAIWAYIPDKIPDISRVALFEYLLLRAISVPRTIVTDENGSAFKSYCFFGNQDNAPRPGEKLIMVQISPIGFDFMHKKAFFDLNFNNIGLYMQYAQTDTGWLPKVNTVSWVE